MGCKQSIIAPRTAGPAASTPQHPTADAAAAHTRQDASPSLQPAGAEVDEEMLDDEMYGEQSRSMRWDPEALNTDDLMLTDSPPDVEGCASTHTFGLQDPPQHLLVPDVVIQRVRHTTRVRVEEPKDCLRCFHARPCPVPWAKVPFLDAVATPAGAVEEEQWWKWELHNVVPGEYTFVTEFTVIGAARELRPQACSRTWDAFQRDAGEPVAGPLLQQLVAGVRRDGVSPAEAIAEVCKRVVDRVKYSTAASASASYDVETILQHGTGWCGHRAAVLLAALKELGVKQRKAFGLSLSANHALWNGHDDFNRHTWVEIFLPGAGWVGVEPTAREPFRIESYAVQCGGELQSHVLWSRNAGAAWKVNDFQEHSNTVRASLHVVNPLADLFAITNDLLVMKPAHPALSVSNVHVTLVSITTTVCTAGRCDALRVHHARSVGTWWKGRTMYNLQAAPADDTLLYANSLVWPRAMSAGERSVFQSEYHVVTAMRSVDVAALSCSWEQLERACMEDTEHVPAPPAVRSVPSEAAQAVVKAGLEAKRAGDTPLAVLRGIVRAAAKRLPQESFNACAVVVRACMEAGFRANIVAGMLWAPDHVVMAFSEAGATLTAAFWTEVLLPEVGWVEVNPWLEDAFTLTPRHIRCAAHLAIANVTAMHGGKNVISTVSWKTAALARVLHPSDDAVTQVTMASAYHR